MESGLSCLKSSPTVSRHAPGFEKETKVKNLYQPYSAPGAVAKNGLEVRLRTILTKQEALSHRTLKVLLTSTLGVALSVLAVRPHLLPTPTPLSPPKIVSPLGQTVLLPDESTVEFVGTYHVAKDKTTTFRNPQGQLFIPSEFVRDHLTRWAGTYCLIEVKAPPRSDVTVSCDGGIASDAGRPHSIAQASTPEISVAFSPWHTVARFNREGKQLLGEPMRLDWKRDTPVAQGGNSWVSEDRLPRSDFRLVGTDSQGKDYVIRWFASSPKSPHVALYQDPKLWPIAKEKIVSYRYETRPWTQVRFEGWKAPKGVTP
jgi:hypothetical protein